MNSFRTSLRLKIRFVRLGSERPSNLYDRFQGELLRRKAFLQSRLFSDLNQWKSEECRRPQPGHSQTSIKLYTQILSVYHDPSELDVVKYLGIISVSHGDLAEVIEEMQWRKVN